MFLKSSNNDGAVREKFLSDKDFKLKKFRRRLYTLLWIYDSYSQTFLSRDNLKIFAADLLVLGTL